LNGQTAIASGIVGILATAVLLAFYLLEAPQAVAAGDKTSRLGAINDALGGVQYLLLAPVAAALRLTGPASAGWPRSLEPLVWLESASPRSSMSWDS